MAEKTTYNLEEEYPSLYECAQCHWEDWDTYTATSPVFNFCPGCGARVLKQEEYNTEKEVTQ